MKSHQMVRVIRALQTGGMTTIEIAESIYATPRSVRYIITKLRSKGQVFIGSWKFSRARRYPSPVYKFGIGSDAKKPTVKSSTERVKDWRKRQLIDDKEQRAARQRMRKWKVKRDPLIAALFGSV